jgi:uncharacterized membrane protein
MRISLSKLASFGRNTAGSIAIMAAAIMPVAVGALALAVDVGALYIERRHAQSTADLAAMAAAADLEHAEAAVAATLQANGIENARALVVTKGNYNPDPRLPPSDRFRPQANPINAVEVTFAKPGRIYFANAFLGQPINMEVRAVAANAALAMFSIGSRLAAVREGLLNTLLSTMLGTSIHLTAMDYEQLIAADVSLLDFMTALATQLNVHAGSFTDVLSTSMTAGDILRAAAASAQDGSASVATTLQTLANQAGSATLNSPLSTLIDLGPLASTSIGDAAPRLDLDLNVMDLVTGTAALANGTRQATLNLGAAIPGLLSLKVDLVVGERAQKSPWVAVGQPGASVYTAQTRLRVVAEVGGTGLLAGARIRLPLGIDVAYAKATLSEVSCEGGNQDTAKAKISARPGIARAWVGELSPHNLANPTSEPSVSIAQIVNLPLIKVTGRADVAATNTTDTMLTFTQADVENKTMKRVGTSQLAQTLVTSLLRNLSLNAEILGLGIGLPGVITQLVANILGSIAAPLDSLIYSLLTTLGVHLGEADVRVHGIRCGTAVLAG